MINFFKKHWEVLSYLVFGVLCTLLNIVLYALFNKLFGYTAANSWGNVLDNIICILFAYCTNRIWVFRSHSKGMDALREFASFIGCRLGTLVMDVAIMWISVDLIGAALVPEGWQGVWFLAVKLVDQVLVILFNYIFSKLIIFKKGQNS